MQDSLRSQTIKQEKGFNARLAEKDISYQSRLADKDRFVRTLEETVKSRDKLAETLTTTLQLVVGKSDADDGVSFLVEKLAEKDVEYHKFLEQSFEKEKDSDALIARLRAENDALKAGEVEAGASSSGLVSVKKEPQSSWITDNAGAVVDAFQSIQQLKEYIGSGAGATLDYCARLKPWWKKMFGKSFDAMGADEVKFTISKWAVDAAANKEYKWQYYQGQVAWYKKIVVASKQIKWRPSS